MIVLQEKKILLFQRLFIWILYLFSGYILYSKKGYLFFTGHRLKKKDSAIKIFADLMLRYIVRMIFRTKIKDTNCALKMFHRKLLKKIKLTSTDYSFPTELCLKTENKNIQSKLYS